MERCSRSLLGEQNRFQSSQDMLACEKKQQERKGAKYN